MRNEATRYFQPALSIACALSYQENPRSESVGDPSVLLISFVGRSKAVGYLAAMVLIASRCYFSATVAGLLFLFAILFRVSFSGGYVVCHDAHIASFAYYCILSASIRRSDGA